MEGSGSLSKYSSFSSIPLLPVYYEVTSTTAELASSSSITSSNPVSFSSYFSDSSAGSSYSRLGYTSTCMVYGFSAIELTRVMSMLTNACYVKLLIWRPSYDISFFCES